MEPQAGRTLSPIHTTKRSNGFLKKTTRRSRVHVQTIGLNAETKKLRHRADAALCLLTFPFIGLVRLPRLPGPKGSVRPPCISSVVIQILEHQRTFALTCASRRARHGAMG